MTIVLIPIKEHQYNPFIKTNYPINFIALQDLTKTTLSGPPRGGFGKSMSSSLSISTATHEGGESKESTTGDGSSSKYLKFKAISNEIHHKALAHIISSAFSSGTTEVEISYLNWIWSNERDIFLGCVMLARSNMEGLEKCIKGKKILDKESQGISEVLLSGFVPGYWVIVGGKTLQDEGFRKQGKNMPIDVFLDLTEKRVSFSEVIIFFYTMRKRLLCNLLLANVCLINLNL